MGWAYIYAREQQRVNSINTLHYNTYWNEHLLNFQWTADVINWLVYSIHYSCIVCTRGLERVPAVARHPQTSICNSANCRRNWAREQRGTVELFSLFSPSLLNTYIYIIYYSTIHILTNFDMNCIIGWHNGIIALHLCWTFC